MKSTEGFMEKGYPWLDEHFTYGLPSLKETITQFESLGWSCQTIGHGHAPWLRDMLGFTIYAWDVLECHDELLDMSEKFNSNLSDYDFSSSQYYRDYVIASKKEIASFDCLIKEKGPLIDNEFKQILDFSKEKVAEKTFSIIKNNNKTIQELNNSIKEVSSWAIKLSNDFKLNQAGSVALNKDLSSTLLSLSAAKLEFSTANGALSVAKAELSVAKAELSISHSAHSATHVELMKMSDLAASMRNKLEAINNNFIGRNVMRVILTGSFSTLVKKIIKKILPNKLLNRYSFNKQRASFESVSQSVSLHGHGKVIIAFPIITWGFRFQRPQHILKKLSEKGYTIIYLAMGMTPKGVKFNSTDEAGINTTFTKLDENIYKIWLHSYDSINIYKDHISNENLNNLSLSIQSALKIIKPVEITYMVQFPGWNRLVFDLKSKHSGNVVFDCMDEHAGFSTNDDRSLKEERELIKNSDIVISSSQLLYDKNIKLNPNTIQVKNGTEFDYFNSAAKNGKLDYLSDKPIIGYYGAISDWFDIEIVEYCAKKLPNYNFVMIGATFGCDISSAEKISNIHFLGEVPYKELSGYFAYFNVCTIPFKIIPLTLATNPVKFYEYISAGKPVVSVKLPELIPYKKCCYLADDKEDFCKMINEALNEKPDGKIEVRKKIAKESSWSKRVNVIYTKIREV